MDFIGRVPFLVLAGKCSSAMETLDFIQQTPVDLIFLDINMPGISGIELISSLPVRPLFILTTAYSEYALESYALDATDYLLKPIPFSRFMKAVNKAHEIYTLRKQTREAGEGRVASPDHFFVRADYQSVRINLDEILYIEGFRDYVRIYMNGRKPILTLQTMKNMAELLPVDHFLRVHKSFIINLNRIDAVERNRILIGEKRIPVGDGFREDFVRKIKTRNIN
jgi:DNA-binding LytR/AlgR family response regulator